MDWVSLTAEQRDFFDANGYLIVRNALDEDTVARLIDVGDRLIASDQTMYRQKNGERYDGFRNVIALDDALLPLLTCSRTVPLVAQLMGPRLQLHTSHLIWKAADPEGTEPTHRAPGWHRDIGRVTQDLDDERMPRLEIKVAYFLTDCSKPACGQTLFEAGSHRDTRGMVRGPNGVDPERAVEPLLNAGDAVFFENRTRHAGGANLSGRTRKTIMFGYSYRWVRPDDYVQQDEALLERCDPIQRSLLDAGRPNYDEKGRFQPAGHECAFARFAEGHGCTGPACW